MLGIPAACTHGGEHPAAKTTTEATSAARMRAYALTDVTSVRRFTLRAPDPVAHAFDVRVEQQPRVAQVLVRIETPYGALTVFDPNVHLLADRVGVDCRHRGERALCRMSFPPFAAERPGRWTVVVQKIAGPPADVRVGVGFRRVATAAVTRARDPTSPARGFARHGIAFSYPSAWFVTTAPLSPVGSPVYRVALSSVPVRQTPADDGPCLGGIARQLPADAVLAYLREALGADRRRALSRVPERPRNLPLPNRPGDLCGFERGAGRWYPFKEGGRVFYLGAYVGPKASPAARRALERVLDGMEIRARRR